MHYDPIKKVLGNFFNKSPFLRILFYKLLDLLLLRAWFIKRSLREWAKSLKQTRGIKILDAGFGFGQYTYFMSCIHPDFQVIGVDVKEDQVQDCTQFFKKIGKEKVDFQVADLTKYYVDQSFDLILCVDVMEHILEDVDVFRNFHRSLKTDGVVLISTPSDQGGSDVHDHDEDESFIGEHVRDGYGVNEIREKMMSAGFSRVDVRYSYGPMGSLSWRLSMKYPILMVNVSKLFFIVLPFYYLITYPFSLVFNYIDVKSNNKTGTGLIVKAYK